VRAAYRGGEEGVDSVRAMPWAGMERPYRAVSETVMGWLILKN
jgi:hypothetical protein